MCYLLSFAHIENGCDEVAESDVLAVLIENPRVEEQVAERCHAFAREFFANLKVIQLIRKLKICEI